MNESMIPTPQYQTRTEINRANSQYSTGPKTAEGKQRSSLNALRHGLTSQNVLIPGEDPEIYNAHVTALCDEHNPQTETESILVQLLADLSWRLLRVATLEANLLEQNINYSAYNDQNERLTAFDKLSRALNNLSLHSQRISRQFDRALQQLRDLQQTRSEQEQKDLDAHPDTTEMYESQGRNATGFVFSPEEISTAQKARTHEHTAQEANQHHQKAA